MNERGGKYQYLSAVNLCRRQVHVLESSVSLSSAVNLRRHQVHVLHVSLTPAVNNLRRRQVLISSARQVASNRDNHVVIK
jgi:hypothetical protein